MKKHVIGLILFIVMISSTVFAEDIKVSVGVKGWSNDWTKRTVIDTDSKDMNGKTIVFHLKDESKTFLIGPTLHIELEEELFIEASYLNSSGDYELSSPDMADTGLSWNDMDIKFGYIYSPENMMYVGYKRFTGSGADTGNPVNISGPEFGGLGIIPLVKQLNVYWDASFLLLKSHTPGYYESNSSYLGMAAELGFISDFRKNLSATIGYKLQMAENKVDNKVDKVRIQDKLGGVTVGLNYNF